MTEQIMRMRGWVWVRGLVIALAALSIACRDGPVAPLVTCQAPITVTVEAGSNPRFNWTPDCGLRSISVEAPPSTGSSPGEMWAIVSDTQLIASGVRYGETPPGVRTRTPARAVMPGTDYGVDFFGELGKSPVAMISWIP